MRHECDATARDMGNIIIIIIKYILYSAKSRNAANAVMHC